MTVGTLLVVTMTKTTESITGVLEVATTAAMDVEVGTEWERVLGWCSNYNYNDDVTNVGRVAWGNPSRPLSPLNKARLVPFSRRRQRGSADDDVHDARIRHSRVAQLSIK